LSIKEKTDGELIADARQLMQEVNNLHKELTKRGVTIDWAYGEAQNTIKYEYSRVTTEPL